MGYGDREGPGGWRPRRRGGAGRRRRRSGLRQDHPGPPRRHDPGLLRHLRRPGHRRRGGPGGLADRLAQAGQPAGAGTAAPMAGVHCGQRGASACPSSTAQDGRRAFSGRRGRRRARIRRDTSQTSTSPMRWLASIPTTGRCWPCATSRGSTRPSWPARPGARHRGPAPGSLAFSPASERSSVMTDRLDFEARLEERLRARAAIASRPFDAVAIAHQAAARRWSPAVRTEPATGGSTGVAMGAPGGSGTGSPGRRHRRGQSAARSIVAAGGPLDRDGSDAGPA